MFGLLDKKVLKSSQLHNKSKNTLPPNEELEDFENDLFNVVPRHDLGFPIRMYINNT